MSLPILPIADGEDRRRDLTRRPSRPIPRPANGAPAEMPSRLDIVDRLTAAPKAGAMTAVCMRKTMMIITDPVGPEWQRAS